MLAWSLLFAAIGAPLLLTSGFIMMPVQWMFGVYFASFVAGTFAKGNRWLTEDIPNMSTCDRWIYRSVVVRGTTKQHTRLLLPSFFAKALCKKRKNLIFFICFHPGIKIPLFSFFLVYFLAFFVGSFLSCVAQLVNAFLVIGTNVWAYTAGGGGLLLPEDADSSTSSSGGDEETIGFWYLGIMVRD